MSWIQRSTLVVRRVRSPYPASTSRRPVSSFLVKPPSPSATRVAPTPLVLCSVEEWVPRQHNALSAYSSVLTESGFACIESRFSPPSRSGTSGTTEEFLELCTNELSTKLQASGHPFPPVVFASGFACLIAQAYISSHPARGLFLVSPPLSNASLYPDILPTPLAEFDYELHFPVAVMTTPDYMASLRTQTRLTPSTWVDLIEVEDLQGDRAVKEVEQWVDELGI